MSKTRLPPEDMEHLGAPIHNVVVGTAGHIDHGKTALIERLTGINADRLPEEQARGMTIDLGFARYRLRSGRRIGIIDVPGHERFVKNMVAGATGIDLVLLVVAADDGVMPQTREHLEIMQLLGLTHGIAVVTKIDLVPDDLRELAIEDVRESVGGTFLETAPVLPVSSVTGEGFDALADTLESCVEAVTPRSTEGVFRMPIQRVFSSKGFGTVLTGVPISGRARAGDTLEVLPLEKTGRVRGIQAYAAAAECAQAGQSSAVNVTDIDYREAHRGMVLATPGHFRHARMIEARLHYLASNKRPLRHLTEIRFHCGTAETLGTVYLLEGKTLEPGSSGLVQLRLEESVVTVPGDRFVLRLHSPMVTIGGGEILDLSRWRLKQGKRFVLEDLAHKEEALGSPRQMVLNDIEGRGLDAVPEKDAGLGIGIPPETVRQAIEELLADGSLVRSSRAGLLLSSRRFEEAKERVRKRARAYFEEHPKRLLMERVVLRGELSGRDAFFNDVVGALERDGELESVRGEYVRWAFHQPRISDAEAAFRETLDAALREAPFSPPSAAEVAAARGVSAGLAATVAALLVEEGEVIALTPDLHMHREGIEQAKAVLRTHLEKEGSMTASTAKSLLGCSRKYIIPLLEHLDATGFTLRRGDVRELRRQV